MTQYSFERHLFKIRVLNFFVVFLKINGELWLTLSPWIFELKSCQLNLEENINVSTQYLTQINFSTLCWDQKEKFWICRFFKKTFRLYNEKLSGVDIAFFWSSKDWLIPSTRHSPILQKLQGQQAWNCWTFASGSKPYASGARLKAFEPYHLFKMLQQKF